MPAPSPEYTTARRAVLPWWTRALPKSTLLTGPATERPLTIRVPTRAPIPRGPAVISSLRASRCRPVRRASVRATTRVRAWSGEGASQGSRTRATTSRLPGAHSSPRGRTDIGTATGSGGWAAPVLFRCQVPIAWASAARKMSFTVAPCARPTARSRATGTTAWHRVVRPLTGTSKAGLSLVRKEAAMAPRAPASPAGAGVRGR